MTAPTTLDGPNPAADATADVVVVGVGYVGLTTAVCMAHLGRAVTAVEIDADKLSRLRSGIAPLHEAGIDHLLREGLAAGRLAFTDDITRVADAPVVMLCLPTPSHESGDLDLSFVERAAQTMRSHLRPGTVVVTKSTVPVGTHRRLAEWLARDDVAVASNPEFLREGVAVSDFMQPDRIVIGATRPSAARAVADLYEGLDAPIQLTDPASAELVKYAANAFLATKVSFVNEMSRLCDHVGADITDVVEGLATDHRIGRAFLTPGPGWGGSCFPKDTRGLAHVAEVAGVTLPVATSAAPSNELHFDHITRRIEELTGVARRDVNAPIRIAVWGAAFKAGTDDVRDSPAIAICDRLVRAGARIVVFDPVASVTPNSDWPPEAHVEASDPYSACDGADLLVVLTEWPEFADADLDKVAQMLARPMVFDTRGVIVTERAHAAGLELHRPGRIAGAS